MAMGLLPFRRGRGILLFQVLFVLCHRHRLQAHPSDENVLRATGSPVVTPRTTVNYDYGWRFQEGTDRKYEECAFEYNVSYADPKQSQIWSGILGSKELCCNECANHDTCRAWDWNGRWCWLSENPTAKKAYPGRWSGKIGPDWPANATHPPHSQLSFDDSLWAVVDAPHDYGRKRVAHCQATG